MRRLTEDARRYRTSLFASLFWVAIGVSGAMGQPALPAQLLDVPLNEPAAPTLAVSASLIAQVTDDLDRDLVLVRGGLVEVRADFDRTDARLHSGFAADLIAIWPRSFEGRSQILAVNATGLHGLRHTSTGWDSESLVPSWAGAVDFVCENVDTNSSPDFLALVNGGSRLEFVLGPAPGAIGPIAGLDLPQPGERLVPVQLDGVGMHELAVLCASGDVILLSTSGILATFPGNGPGGAIAALGCDGFATESIGWLRPNGAGTDHEQVTISVTLLEQLGGVLGDADISGVSAVDYDGDGDDDLVIGSRTTHDVRVWTNSATPGSDPVFATGDGGVLVSTYGSAGAAERIGPPAVGDVDRDRDPDVVSPLAASGRLLTWYNSTIDQRALMPKTDYVFHDRIFDGEGFTGDAHVRLELQDADVVPASATHVEVHVRFRPDVSLPTPSVGDARFLLPRYMGSPVVALLGTPGPAYTQGYSLPIWIGDPPPCPLPDLLSQIDSAPYTGDAQYSARMLIEGGDAFHAMIFLEQRYVQLVDEGLPSERIAQVWPSYIQVVTMDCGSVDPAAFQIAMQFATSPSPLVHGVPTLAVGLPPQDSAGVTTTTENKPVTDLPPDEDPKDAPNTTGGN